MTSNVADPGPRGRRERPAKPALTRQGIIDTALGILFEEGLAKVTMRRIARMLDTGHASLYVYVRDTEDLHAQILDALLAAVELEGTGCWRERLKAVLTSYGDVLRNYPEMARMALSTQPNGPHYAAVIERVLALLSEGGADDRAAAWGVDLLLLLPTAMAVEHNVEVSPKREAERMSDMAERLGAVDPQRFPNIARLGPELVSGDGPGRSSWALDVVLDGILARSAAPKPPTT
ncbi:TetR/AcrR family transcriptional regulator [Actinoplanes sp. NPDC026623]|uniref:TetR/AcrR family transcriptional regulator n=1 Tax=Actinoplanes sp. NPDC026623 TaxID=3155610 RepID=UPI00340337F0